MAQCLSWFLFPALMLNIQTYSMAVRMETDSYIIIFLFLSLTLMYAENVVFSRQLNFSCKILLWSPYLEHVRIFGLWLFFLGLSSMCHTGGLRQFTVGAHVRYLRGVLLISHLKESQLRLELWSALKWGTEAAGYNWASSGVFVALGEMVF